MTADDSLTVAADNSYPHVILLGSTLLERILELKGNLNGRHSKEIETRNSRINLFLAEQINNLWSMISEFVPQTEAQEELAKRCIGILDASRMFVKEILNSNVCQLYQIHYPESMMLGFFVQSIMRTLNAIKYLTTRAIAGYGCEQLDCDSCLQDLREEWSDVQAVRNSVKVFLLVAFIQRHDSQLPRNLIIEMANYAQTNYTSHCPEIYQEALEALKTGHKVLFPITIHIFPP